MVPFHYTKKNTYFVLDHFFVIREEFLICSATAVLRGIRSGLLVTLSGSQAWCHWFKSPLETLKRVGLVSIYKCAALWRAVYGASVTERPIATIHKEKRSFAVQDFYLVTIWPIESDMKTNSLLPSFRRVKFGHKAIFEKGEKSSCIVVVLCTSFSCTFPTCLFLHQWGGCWAQGRTRQREAEHQHWGIASVGMEIVMLGEDGGGERMEYMIREAWLIGE